VAAVGAKWCTHVKSFILEHNKGQGKSTAAPKAKVVAKKAAPAKVAAKPAAKKAATAKK
jgi:hypothetical protein